MRGPDRRRRTGRDGAPRTPSKRRVRAALPTDRRRCRPTRDRRRRGADALEPPRARARVPRRVHAGSRGHGLIVPVGTWVLDEVVPRRPARGRTRSPTRLLDVKVNVSARQLAQADFVDLADALAHERRATRAHLPRDHRERADARRRPARGRRCASARSSASGSRSTTSAPATRRSATCAASASTSEDRQVVRRRPRPRRPRTPPSSSTSSGWRTRSGSMIVAEGIEDEEQCRELRDSAATRPGLLLQPRPSAE